MGYRGHGEKNSDENNTVRRYRADSNKQRVNKNYDVYYDKIPKT